MQKKETGHWDGLTGTRFMLDLLSGRMDELSAKRELHRIGLGLNHNELVIVLFSAESDPLAFLLIDPAGMICDGMKQAGAIWAMALPGDVIACVINCTAKEIDHLLINTENMRKLLEQATERSVTAGVGEYVEKLSQLDEAYHSAVRSMALRRLLGNGQTLFYRRDVRRVHIWVDYTEYLDKVDESVRSGKLNMIQKLLLILLRKENARLKLPCQYQEIYIQTSEALVRAILRYHDVDAADLAYDVGFWNDIAKIRNEKSLCHALRLLLVRYMELVPDRSVNRLLVEKALHYIRHNYEQRIMLTDMAERLNISASYFSRLFRAETGENFVTCLSRIRIEKAKELLADPNLKIYQIADQVGYADVQYFNHVFRTTTGMTPSAYRNRCANVKKTDKKTE